LGSSFHRDSAVKTLHAFPRDPLGLNRRVFGFSGMSRKLHIKTFGCQMNDHDSARMADVLAASQLELTEDPA
jgi:hypothetical protein